jgi:hypothetical protein
MKTTKYILMIIVLTALISLATTDAIAGGHHHGHSSVSIGIGFGGPSYYGSYWYGRHHGYYDMGFYYGYPYYDPYYDYPVVVERPVVIAQPAPIVVTPPAPVVEKGVDGRAKGDASNSQTAAPATLAAPAAANTVVWIKNDNGSQTPVTLRQQGAGFVGPSNEYYSTLPTEEQLKAQYGLKSSIQPTDTVTVMIDNGNGSKTPITLKKDGINYIGPAGEVYTTLPTEAQLKALYGVSPSTSQTDFNVEITKADGTKVIVALKKEGTEFVGPRDERYPSMPTEEHLKLIYGK